MARAKIETLDARQVLGVPRPPGRRALRWFFPVVSSLLFAGLLVGFAKTFFLRSQFNVPPIPPYLYVHGSVLTTWFVLVLAQTCLVAAHRTDLHRRLGIVAVVVGVLIIPISAFVVVHAAQRTHGAITLSCDSKSLVIPQLGVVRGFRGGRCLLSGGCVERGPSRITQSVTVWPAFSGQPWTIFRTDFSDDPVGGIWRADRRVEHAE